MVKADIKRDYYADLGIDPKAEEDEIRKKYRKLALKFHPDRNPGKELEFNAKFQAIQAAYEILIDPKERLKYDTGRLRAGYGKFYGPPRTSAPSPRPQYAQPNYSQPRRAPTPGTDPKTAPNPGQKPRKTPTPGAQPRRAAEQNAQHHAQGFPHPGSYPTPPSAGAQKYSSYAKAGQKWDKMYEDTRTRADAFRGFQEMKQNASTGGWSGFDPRTGRSNPTTTNPQGSHRPQSAYEAYFNIPKPSPQRAQAKKKHGFAPGTPGGDEPMAQNTSAYANYTRARASYPEPNFEPAPPPTAKKWPSQEESTSTNMPNLQRTSSRYATAGGERTYLSGTGLGRSSSTRESPFTESDSRPRTNPPSPTSPQANRGRHHSASPKVKSNREQTFSSSLDTSDSEEVNTASRPKKTPRSRIFANNAKKDPFTNMKEDFGEDPLGWATYRDSWLFDEPHIRPSTAPRHTRRGRWNPDTDYEIPQGHPINNINTEHNSQGHSPFAKAYPQYTHATDNHAPNPDGGNFPDSPKQSRTPDKSNNMYGPSHKPFAAHEWSEKWGFTSPTSTTEAPKHSFPLWAYPSSILPQFFKAPKGSNGTGGQGSATQQSDENPHDRACPYTNTPNSTQKDQSSMNADPISTFSFGPFTNNPTLNGKPKSRSHESIDVTFSAEDWNGKFKHATEFFAPKPSRDQRTQPKSSRTRGRSISRPNSATHPRPFPPPGDSSQSQQENINKYSSAFVDSKFSVDKWTEEVLKINIWTLPHNELSQPSQTRQKSPKKQSKSTAKRPPTMPKPVTVTTEAEEAEATVPDGKAEEPKQSFTGGEEAMDIDEGLPASKPPQPQPEPQPQPIPPNTTTGTAPKPLAPSPKEPKSDSTLPNSTLNLKNLTNVAPFTATNSTGINDLNDLSSTLPFESRPNDSSRTRLTVRPQDLALPKPPKVPAAPKFTEHTSKAEMQNIWERYVAEINAYMHDWNLFNRTMLGHFNARQHAVETGLAPNWAGAVGDSTRLRLDGEPDSSSKKTGTGTGSSDGNDADDEADGHEQLIAGSGKGGFSAYLRGVKEDFVVRQHWEVAWERHLACLEGLDGARRAMKGLRNGRNVGNEAAVGGG
ncbi:hypothetical protein AJ79_05717 [Helicocarpus griseus UAMH5409]|uniref:J domain-containing protein n=1 Tax=Helicocarpus griseus UAMH5409 TaxID=1447875 RepID=A0A2B7XKP7_9EURO|nr:hypothetical protein AJ79_05717 [Helicocarpus griseus UAMH5409]